MSYAGVAQYLLNDLGVLALFEHQGGEGVPEIVEPYVWQARAWW